VGSSKEGGHFAINNTLQGTV